MSKRVVYLGQPGSFSYLAAKKLFGQDFEGLPSTEPEELIQSLIQSKADLAILPIENTLGSSVLPHYDLLYKYQSQVRVVQEVYLQVKHCLLSVPGAKIENIKKVYAHPQAFLQSRVFWKDYPNISRESVENTALAMQTVSQVGEPTLAAIGSREGVYLYGLEILKSNIQDHEVNFTRFVVLSRQGGDISKQFEANLANKCSVAFKLQHRPKSLLSAIETISQDFINLTKIESRPIPGTVFEYIFYVDFEFELDNLLQVQRVLENLDQKVVDLRIFGFYLKDGIPNL